MLLGRANACERVESLLDGAKEGRSGALLAVGEAGIGKSALLDFARARAEGMRILQARGTEYEANLPFAALHALVRPLFGAIDRIPPAQARSLRAALALGEPADADRLAAYAGTLSLLAEAADQTPTLVLLDDLQWLDAASAEAILFAARRVAGEAIVLLLCARTGGAPLFEASELPRLELPPLDAASSRALLRARHGTELAADVERRLLSAAGGNPLALVELPALLTDSQLAGREGLQEPLKLTEEIQRAFLSSVGQLSPDAQSILLLAAASEDGAWAVVRDAARLCEVDAAAVEAAEAAGLVRLAEGSVHFRHPLMRSAVYGAAAAAERRAAHRALGRALADSPDRSAWHLAAAAEGVDESIASALEETAERARSRGGYAAQASALERAAELSEDHGARCRRLHAAAVAAYWAGEPERGLRLARAALPLARDPLLRADVNHRLAVIADWHGRWRDAAIPSIVLERQADEIEPLDPRRAAALLGVVLQRRFQALETREALVLASRRVTLCEPAGSERYLRALQDLVRAHALRGDVREAAAGIERVLELSPRDELLEFATNIAEPLIWLERYELARRLLSVGVAEARADGNIVRLVFELTNLAVLELRTGRLIPAVAAASEAHALAVQTGNEYIEACNLTTLARVDAARGDGAECGRRAERAAALAGRLGDELIRSETQLALGSLALAVGRPQDAVAVLEPVADLVERNEVGEPSVLPYAPDLIEAYLRLGRAADAHTALGRFRDRARNTGRRWALAAAARCEALAVPDEDVDAAFTSALAVDAGESASFERARTELLYGERLRRMGRRVHAREQLRAAAEAFERLGAHPWTERARGELRATGETWRKRDPAAAEQLTPQELQIALQVAQGRSNREAGAALFLSPKTIEFHLTRAYRKLDIHSRAELIRLFAADAR